MTTASNDSATIRNYLETAFRYKYLLILFNLVVIAMTTAIVLWWPRQYRSEAKLWIKIGRENSKLDPTAATGETISVQDTDREDETSSVIDILGSRGVISKAVESVGYAVVLADEPLPGASESQAPHPLTTAVKSVIARPISMIKQIDAISDREAAIEQVRKNLTVDKERKSNVVSIHYDADSPELAQAVVMALIDGVPSRACSNSSYGGVEGVLRGATPAAQGTRRGGIRQIKAGQDCARTHLRGGPASDFGSRAVARSHGQARDHPKGC